MIRADGTKPLVPVSDGMDGTRDLLIQVAGTAANLALIATVAGVVIGAVMFGFGTAIHRPDWARRGIAAVIGAIASAIVTAGLNSWIAWFGDRAIELWH
jgi:outer membrane lipoprotein SlyB